MKDFKASASAFERGLKLEPGNAGLKSGLQNSQARIPTDDTSSPDESSSAANPNPAAGFGGMADMMRNMGGMGAGGGMPDIASLMNNPQLMAMAQQMAANGGLANLLQNPRVADMVSFSLDFPAIIFTDWDLKQMSRVQSGNMPSMDEILADPTMRDLYVEDIDPRY